VAAALRRPGHFVKSIWSIVVVRWSNDESF